MKLVVKKEILLESLNNTARAISTKNLIPILTGIKFELKDKLFFWLKNEGAAKWNRFAAPSCIILMTAEQLQNALIY